jgi:hypothetical protein
MVTHAYIPAFAFRPVNVAYASLMANMKKRAITLFQLLTHVTSVVHNSPARTMLSALYRGERINVTDAARCQYWYDKSTILQY